MNNKKIGIKLSVVALGAACCVVFFFFYSFLPLAVPWFHNSPDENANAVFAKSAAESGQLHRWDPLNLMLDDRVHPRSVKVVDGLQVPGGFLGLPVLFGGLAKAVGVGAIPFLTPMFSLLGVLAWGALIRRRFGTATGVLAGILLATCPAWWYWSSRTMMPNVLFVSLLLIAAYFLFSAPILSGLEKRAIDGLRLLRRFDGAVSGMFCGLALTVRPDGGYWLVIIALVKGF